MALGKKIAQQTGDQRETAFLFQHQSVSVQRFNCVLLHDSFDSMRFQIRIFVSKSLGILDTECINNNNNKNNLYSPSTRQKQYRKQERTQELT